MAPESVSFLNIVIFAVLAASVGTIAIFGVSLFRTLKAKAKASMSAEQWTQLESWARVLVMAAEQSGLSGRIKDEGAAKRLYVLAQLKKYAADHGLAGLDVDAFDALIEGKVYEVINAPTPVIEIPAQ